jgi:Tol biopolymer transport system component
VTGTGFVSTSEVHWNGTLRATTFVSATELEAQIEAADIANPGTAQVTVFNPAPGGGTSAAVAFPISAPLGLERVSLSTAGEEGDAGSGPTSGDSHAIAVSQDGRFVVFTSGATNLAAGADNGGNNVEDVFVRDTCRGASAPGDCFKTTSRITGPAAPEPGNDYVDITADGQWITFTSSGIDGGVWVAPRSGGAAVRLTSTDAEVRFSSFINPAISDDGRFVAVQTPFGFVPEDTNLFFSDIYLFDRDADGNGVFDEAPASVTLISATPSGAAGNGPSVDADISANGRYVVFSSVAPDLVPGSGSESQVYLRDTCMGVADCTAATILISVGPSDPGNFGSLHPRITPDARSVVFDSGANNLLPPGGDANAFSDIYVHDTCIGGPDGCVPSNIRVTRAANGGETNERSLRPSISADGRFVAFESQADNLVSGFPSSFFFHVFATDTCIGATGCTQKTNLLSQVNGSLGNSGSSSAVISPDGRFVDFESAAANLVSDDTNGVGDIFLSGSGLP